MKLHEKDESRKSKWNQFDEFRLKQTSLDKVRWNKIRKSLKK